MKRAVRLIVLCGFAAAFCLGVAALVSETEAAGCICPLIYAPVICDHGKTYPNQCVADCHHAKNCVPTGGI